MLPHTVFYLDIFSLSILSMRTLLTGSFPQGARDFMMSRVGYCSQFHFRKKCNTVFDCRKVLLPVIPFPRREGLGPGTRGLEVIEAKSSVYRERVFVSVGEGRS